MFFITYIINGDSLLALPYSLQSIASQAFETKSPPVAIRIVGRKRVGCELCLLIASHIFQRKCLDRKIILAETVFRQGIQLVI